MRCCATGRQETGVTLPQPGHYAVAMCFLPREAKARDIVVKQFEHFIKVEGQKPDRLARRADRSHGPGQDRARTDAADPPGDRRARAARSRTRTRSSASCSPSASRPRIRWRSWRRSTSCRPSPSSTCRSFSTRTVVYKGLLLAPDVGRFYRDLRNPLTHIGDCAGASALLDQHLPVLEAGASLSLHRP